MASGCILIGILIGLLLFIFIGMPIQDYKRYKENTMEESEKYDNGTFDDFVLLLNKLFDNNSTCYTNYIVNVINESSVSNNIIKFNNKGMILNFKDYRKAMKILKQKTKQYIDTKKTDINWN